ncbi:uncharacterized protein BKA55DRAFT_687751 [Fusarium redolens]|uniref:Uncharacterized protein n=1 Tax=Fusarium redolens TaxID=48865 RepID=A0A9P9KMR4_FUSRE|nr:uncharacterized protein BKA55DRAFT_687751 [Fusarium redolens]KAH7259454.1 hypothetical protein BKA55DRAFT_687751 [Fusarium redolens]
MSEPKDRHWLHVIFHIKDKVTSDPMPKLLRLLKDKEAVDEWTFELRERDTILQMTISHHYKAHHFTKNIPINTTNRHILKMPNSSETTVFTRTGNTAGVQESVQKLADEWKGKGIKIETGPNKITFITPPGGQRASDYSVKNFRARMEKDGLWSDWKVAK